MGEAKRRRVLKPGPDSGMEVLSGEEASQRLMEGRADEVFLPLSEFRKWANLGLDKLREEAASGRLVITGTRGPNQTWLDLSIRADHAVEWMAKYRRSN